MISRISTIKAAIISGFVLAAIAPVPALAGMVVSGWWEGNWSCNIDGRPARMNWKVADVPNTKCSGGVCSTTSGVAWRGGFSDNGAPWVPLTFEKRTAQDGLFFRHADGNLWFLPRPSGNRTAGWTTWQGRRYPLSCRR